MIVTLQIKSWMFQTHIPAAHFYGVLRCPGQKPTRLERILDADEAELLNVYDNTPGAYREGSPTERFRSAEQVRDKAQKVWPTVYPDATGLEEIPWSLGS